MDVSQGYRHIEKLRGGVQWYMMESKVFISTINSKLKNENGNLVSSNGQSMTLRLSIKKINSNTINAFDFNKTQIIFQ